MTDESQGVEKSSEVRCVQPRGWPKAMAALVGGVIAIGGFAVLLPIAGSTRTRGATRAATLEWQRRQVQIREAIAEGKAAPNTPVVAPKTEDTDFHH